MYPHGGSSFSNFSIMPFTLNCVTSVLVSHPFRYALTYARISLIFHNSIYFELCYISASLTRFSARIKVRSHFSNLLVFHLVFVVLYQ